MIIVLAALKKDLNNGMVVVSPSVWEQELALTVLERRPIVTIDMNLF